MGDIGYIYGYMLFAMLFILILIGRGITMGIINTNHRKTLYKKYNGICPECGKKMSLNNPRAINTYMTIDHIVPKSLGGTNNIGNLRPLCRECNRKRKSDMTNISYQITEDFHYIGKVHYK